MVPLWSFHRHEEIPGFIYQHLLTVYIARISASSPGIVKRIN